MVLPAQNSEVVTPKTEGILYVPDIASETKPLTPEGLPAPSNQMQPQQKTGPDQKDIINKTPKDNPQSGKIVDKAKDHKEKISTLATDDNLTKEADEEENEFIPLVEEAHDNLSL